MSETSEIGQLLHEEHFRFLVSICGLQNRVGEAFRHRPLDPRNPGERSQLDDLIAGLDDIIDHHRFEEANLFPLFRERGNGDLVTALLREHVTIEPKANRLRSLASALRRNGATPARWLRFRHSAEALIADMMRHLETEEACVFQRLPILLDKNIDNALARDRAARRKQSG